jgi:hypothetical protein
MTNYRTVNVLGKKRNEAVLAHYPRICAEESQCHRRPWYANRKVMSEFTSVRRYMDVRAILLQRGTL